MTPSLKKRFWKEATVENVADGFSVALDGRMLRTPAKASLVVPTKKIADLIATEWMAQEEKVNPELMPATRMANSAIDKVSANRDAVVDMLAEYSGTDLLSYRAESQIGLYERQSELWDPILDWAGQEFNAMLKTTRGVMHIEQDPNALKNLKKQILELSNFQIAGFHDLVVLSGSFVIALAVFSNHLGAEEAWNISRVDENWQIELWGEDEMAQEATEIKRVAFHFAKLFLDGASTLR